jgi:hypothetical protein
MECKCLIIFWLKILIDLVRRLSKYYSGDQIEKNEMGGTCRAYGERRDAHRVLAGKPEGKRPLGRSNR